MATLASQAPPELPTSSLHQPVQRELLELLEPQESQPVPQAPPVPLAQGPPQAQSSPSPPVLPDLSAPHRLPEHPVASSQGNPASPVAFQAACLLQVPLQPQQAVAHPETPS